MLAVHFVDRVLDPVVLVAGGDVEQDCAVGRQHAANAQDSEQVLVELAAPLDHRRTGQHVDQRLNDEPLRQLGVKRSVLGDQTFA